MSEYTTPLPPASVDITELRHAIDVAAKTSDGRQAVRAAVFESVGLVVIVAAIVAATAAADFRLAVAVGGGVLLVGFALIFVLPMQVRRRRTRESLDAVSATVDDATSRVQEHLASIGYSVPRDVALEWLTSPEPAATVALVHESVIAARWWRPAEGDDRVFLEPFLRRPDQDAALPVLPPMQRD